ncbi:MAG: hypothetical protein HYW86_00010 [Candidatus Roizmanbacteria bacterium]|nr:MAG: hypothetical protein HYW86_00010 [Candidatus Roizmanbacteria bacterium]
MKKTTPKNRHVLFIVFSIIFIASTFYLNSNNVKPYVKSIVPNLTEGIIPDAYGIGGSLNITQTAGTFNPTTLSATGNITTSGGNVGIGTANPLGSLHVGSSALFVSSTNGNVGIGTTAPGASLHINNSGGMWVGASSKRVSIFTSGAGEDISSSNTLHLNYNNDKSVSIGEGGTSNLYTSGNVGIGTANPGAKLELGSGQIFVPTGSSTAPSYSFTGDSNTGIFSPTGGGVSIASDGTETFRFHNDALNLKVTQGISWVDLPSGGGYLSLVWGGNYILDQRASTNANAYRIYNTYTDGSNYERAELNWQANSNVFTIQTAAGGTGTVRNIALMGGNVGIGTTSPTTILGQSGSTMNAKAMISGPGGVSTPILQLTENSAYSSGTDKSAGIYFGAMDSASSVQASSSILGISNFTASQAGTGAIAFRTKGTHNIDDTDVERMRITSTGNLGIGTTNPGAKLELTYNPAAAAMIGLGIGASAGGSTTGNATINLQADVANADISMARSGLTHFGNNLILRNNGTSTNAGITFQTNGSNGRMTITNSGNVGIGTTNPYASVYVANSGLTKGYGLEYGMILSSADDRGIQLRSNYDPRDDGLVDSSYGSWVIGMLGRMGTGSTTPMLGFWWSPPNTEPVANGAKYYFKSDGNGQAASSWTSGLGDLAEIYKVTGSYEKGDLVVSDKSTPNAMIKSAGKPYDPDIMGIISAAPGLVIGAGNLDDPNQGEPIALTGKVSTKASLENGAINIGDPLTSSSTPGTVMKATKYGKIIGRALEFFDGSVKVSKGTIDILNQKAKAEDKPKIPYEETKAPNTYNHGKILVFVDVSLYDPDLYLTSTGDLKLLSSNPSNPSSSSYSLSDKNGIIDRIGAFAQIVVAKLQAGIIETKKLIVSGVDILEKLNDLSKKVDQQQKEIQILKQEINSLKAN